MIGIIVTWTVGVTISVYGITTYFLFKHPEFIHGRKKFPIVARHISHRGGCGERIENSIEAFDFAVSVGTEMLELDCHLTKDSQVVVFHDKTLDRCTGVSGAIADFRYDELPTCLDRLGVQFDKDGVCDRTGEPNCRIPLLSEIFERFPTVPVILEIKVDDDNLICEVANIIHAFKREKLTIWGGLTTSISNKCWRANKDILTYSNKFFTVYALLAYYLGFVAFLPIPYDCFALPMISTLPKTDYASLWESCRAKLILSISDWLLNSPTFVKHLERRGIPVFIWVANNEEQFDRAFELGAAGVMTDYPSALSVYLRNTDRTS